MAVASDADFSIQPLPSVDCTVLLLSTHPPKGVGFWQPENHNDDVTFFYHSRD